MAQAQKGGTNESGAGEARNEMKMAAGAIDLGAFGDGGSLKLDH